MFLFAREIFPSEILKQFTPLEIPSRDPVARFVAAAVEELDNTHAVPPLTSRLLLSTQRSRLLRPRQGGRQGDGLSTTFAVFLRHRPQEFEYTSLALRVEKYRPCPTPTTAPRSIPDIMPRDQCLTPSLALKVD